MFFTHIVSVDYQQRDSLLYLHFTEERDSERLSDSPKVTQLMHGRVGKEIWDFWCPCGVPCAEPLSYHSEPWQDSLL